MPSRVAVTALASMVLCAYCFDPTDSATADAGGLPTLDASAAHSDAGFAGLDATATMSPDASSSSTCGASTTTFSATGTDQSAVTVDGTTKTLANATITSDSNTSSQDNSSFYGQNAGVLAENGGVLAMSCVSVTTTGTGANGVFATGSGSKITLANVTIKCAGDGGHGVDATQTATLSLQDVDIDTAGAHGAAIATDRGGGTITAVGGNVITSGTDSPGIYSTGSITVSGAIIKATNAEAAVIEGANSISLTNTALAAASGTRGRGLMIYQSMSGDAQGTKGIFTMSGGSFTWPATSGPVFYVTNSTGVITLSGVALSSSSPTLFKASSDQWGTTGANGGNIDLTADGQAMIGDVAIDNLSTFTASLKNQSSLTGTINSAKTAKSASLTLDASSTWTLTADSAVTSLTDADSTFANIASQGHSICYSGSVNGSSTGSYGLPGGGSLEHC